MSNLKILILCTGNSCRSQMAHGILQSFDKNLIVCSAGTHPATKIHPTAIKVLNEIGIDISKYYPKNVSEYINEKWDFVITVCGGAAENCPTFLGDVKNRIHIGFEDPSHIIAEEEFVLNEFRKTRDEIKTEFLKLYLNKINTTQSQIHST